MATELLVKGANHDHEVNLQYQWRPDLFCEPNEIYVVPCLQNDVNQIIVVIYSPSSVTHWSNGGEDARLTA